MTTSIGNINPLSYGNVAAGSSPSISKLYVPVNKSALLYSHLSHVQGVAAKAGENGVSINKIHILNSLIEHASSLKSDNKPDFSSLSDKEIDNFMKDFHKQIQQSMKNPYILSGEKPFIGEFFSIKA